MNQDHAKAIKKQLKQVKYYVNSLDILLSDIIEYNSYKGDDKATAKYYKLKGEQYEKIFAQNVATNTEKISAILKNIDIQSATKQD